MSDPQLLAKLRDIHLPEPISFWPLAPGWYALALLSLLLIGLAYYFIRRSQKNAAAKRQALILLQDYEQDYLKNKNSQVAAMNVSELLRRVALVYFPRDEVAGLEGEAWLLFLTKTSKGLDFRENKETLLVAPYQPIQLIDLEPLFYKARGWIKQRGKPCSN
jgi:cbb3-type cytochrome oxidase subunit 3